MRATEFLTEIENMYQQSFSGGKKDLQGNKIDISTLKYLPGGSGYMYTINKLSYITQIMIADPKSDATKPIALLTVSTTKYPFSKPPLQVGTITVDEDYRGRGLAKALYGIVLTIMKKPLVSGDMQTPGGKRNWLSLVNIPGVEIKGIIRISNNELIVRDLNYSGTNEKNVDKKITQLMQLGGQFLGKNEYASYWAFDVVPGKSQLHPYIKNKLSKLYGYDSDNVLIATWNGE